MRPKINFFKYWRICTKHFGKQVWADKGKELISAFIFSITVCVVSLIFGDLDASRAFEIAVVALAGWLAVYALGHLIRTPWLVHQDANNGKLVEEHWGFGILGMAIVVLIVMGLVALGIVFYRPQALRISFPSADPGAKNAEIAQLKDENRALQTTRNTTNTGHTSNKTVAPNDSDDPEISLTCVIVLFPIRIGADQRIDTVLLIPGLQSGTDPVENTTKFSRSWPNAQATNQAGIKCDIQNHGNESVTARLGFDMYWRDMQGPPPGVEKKRSVLIEPIDGRQTRTFYLANWCQNLIVTVVIPQTAFARFVGESKPTKRSATIRQRSRGINGRWRFPAKQPDVHYAAVSSLYSRFSE